MKPDQGLRRRAARLRRLHRTARESEDCEVPPPWVRELERRLAATRRRLLARDATAGWRRAAEP